jgi:diguanylate cyclase (GGDEF)-like protein
MSNQPVHQADRPAYDDGASQGRSRAELDFWIGCLGAPVLVVDPATMGVLTANDCAAGFFLHAMPDLSGRRIGEVIGNEAEMLLSQIWSRSAEGTAGDPFLINGVIGGQDRRLMVRVTRLRLEGRPVRLFTFADAPPSGSVALADWQESMMEILNWIPFGFEISDNNDEIQFANAYCRTLFGYSQDQLHSVEDWWRLAYPDPDYRAYARRRWESEIAQARRENREMMPFDLDVATASGETRTIQFRHRTIGRFNVNLYLDFTRERAYRQELKRLAGTDSLTGVMNRRRFFEEALRHVGSPPSEPTALMMLDVDHFKQVNDGHGHGGGDAVLQEVTRRMSSVLRGRDLIARLGGEEFAVLLPKTRHDEAIAIAERLRQAVCGEPCRLPGTELTVSVSVGVTTRQGADTLDILLSRADKALYEAKRLGRNRVECGWL